MHFTCIFRLLRIRNRNVGLVLWWVCAINKQTLSTFRNEFPSSSFSRWLIDSHRIMNCNSVLDAVEVMESHSLGHSAGGITPISRHRLSNATVSRDSRIVCSIRWYCWLTRFRLVDWCASHDLRSNESVVHRFAIICYNKHYSFSYCSIINKIQNEMILNDCLNCLTLKIHI